MLKVKKEKSLKRAIAKANFILIVKEGHNHTENDKPYLSFINAKYPCYEYNEINRIDKNLYEIKQKFSCDFFKKDIIEANFNTLYKQILKDKKHGAIYELKIFDSLDRLIYIY